MMECRENYTDIGNVWTGLEHLQKIYLDIGNIEIGNVEICPNIDMGGLKVPNDLVVKLEEFFNHLNDREINKKIFTLSEPIDICG